MTKEELKEHCRKTIDDCEEFAKYRGQKPKGKTYEEHELVYSMCMKLEKLERILKDYGFNKDEKSGMKYLSDLEKDLINEIYDWNKPYACRIN